MARPAAVIVGAVVAAAAWWTLTRKKSRGTTAASVVDLIGNTPVLELPTLSKETGCRIVLKLECANPGGSAKDRVAKAVIERAESEGLLVHGEPGSVFEGTSGSTGISLATVCNARGYKAHIVIPDDTGAEKVQMLQMLGAIVHKVPPAGIADPGHYVNTARRLAQECQERAVFADQFETEANWYAHYTTTGPELVAQVGRIDAFVNGAGTGGTIAGVGRYLKECSNALVVLADPPGSGLYHKINSGVMFDLIEKEGTKRRHQVDTVVEGIGLNRVTNNLSHGLPYIDSAIRVSDAEALGMAKRLVATEGIFVGSSTAVNCAAAVELAKELGPGHTIVTVWCDSGMRHLSKFWKQS